MFSEAYNESKCSMTLTGVGQADEVVVFERESLGFESSHPRSTSPVGGPLLAADSFLKMKYIDVSLTEKVKR